LVTAFILFISYNDSVPFHRQDYNLKIKQSTVMKRTIKSITGYNIGATDGEIGKAAEFYFDDKTWTIRYLIVETGHWLSGRKVLISPEAFAKPDHENKVFHLNLTKDQIENSPDIDTDKPVSRREEMDLYKYYPWTNYWDGELWAGGMGITGMMTPMPVLTIEETPVADAQTEGSTQATRNDHVDEHLRSSDKVTSYTIKAADGNIGDVEDFIVDDLTWKIEFIEVDTGNWLPGKKVLIPPSWIRNIDWQMSEVTVIASIDAIKHSPEYDPDLLLKENYVPGTGSYYKQTVPLK